MQYYTTETPNANSFDELHKTFDELHKSIDEHKHKTNKTESKQGKGKYKLTFVSIQCTEQIKRMNTRQFTPQFTEQTKETFPPKE